MSDIVVVDDGRTYVSTETAEVATEAAARAKQWAQESERQANIATSNADTAVQAKDDAVAAKNYAEAAITDTNLVTVATDLQATPSNIKTVSTNISNVNSVASNIANVNAVAGNATNINAVNANKTNIDKVAGDINRVKLVADDIASVHTVAVDISNVIDVASNKANIDTVAGSISDVMSVSTSISNVNAVADDLTAINAVNANKTNIDAVNTNKININTVAGINTDVSTVAGIASDVTTVSSISTDVTAVKNNATNINAVNSNKTNIDTVASIASDITTVASDVTNINTAVTNLPAINAAPTYANNSKIWAEGLDGEVTPLGGTHSSKVWAQIAEQAASGVQNPANRDLSNLSNTGQKIIDTANGTISKCILEIPQNIKVSIESNVIKLAKGSILTNTGSTYSTITTTVDRTRTIATSLIDGIYFIFADSASIHSPRILSKVTSGNSNNFPIDNLDQFNTYYNIDDKLIYRYNTNTSAWDAFFTCYPICLIEMKSGVASFAKDSNGNDIIFNGAGFLGHHIFRLPNVSGYSGEGFTSGGKLNSNFYSPQNLLIQEMASTNPSYGKKAFGFQAATRMNYVEVDTVAESPAHQHIAWVYTYVREQNQMWVWTGNGLVKQHEVPLVYYGYNGTTVTDFTICQPYDGARYLLTDKKADDSSVVHNKGDERISDHKLFDGTIDYENKSNTTNYRGRQYQQLSGELIEGLQNKTNSSWLNYIQFKTDGSVKFSGTALTIPTPTENTASSTQADTVGARVTMLDALYPVGSVYIGTQSTCPLATLIPNSTWQLQNSGLVLQCSDSSHTAGTTISAGLPNITGILGTHSYAGEQWSKDGSITGAFYKDTSLSENHIKDVSGTNNGTYNFGFDASRSNAIYGNSTTVQPPALVVNVWIRTA